MKYYYYFLYRLYKQLSSKYSEEKIVQLLTVTTSTFVIFFLLMTLYLAFGLFVFPILFKGLNKMEFTLFIVLVGILNYLLFIRNKKFLNFGFKQDNRGIYYIILFLIFLFVIFVILAKISRDRIIQKGSLY